MNLLFFIEGEEIPHIQRRIRTSCYHPVQGLVEGMFEGEGNGNAFLRIPDHLKDIGDYIGLRLRIQHGLDPFAPYLLCPTQSITFLS